MKANDSNSFKFYFIFFKFLHAVESTKEIRLEAVTDFQGLGEFYELIEIEGRQRHREIDAETKNEICRHIFNSRFFGKDYQVHVSAMEKATRKKLKKKYRSVFDKLYYMPATNSPWFQRSKKKTEYVHVNPDTVRKVAVGALTYEESVFVCLARHTLADTIREYFVSSDSYNVNREINANGINDYIAGRFVFSVGFADTLVLVALAEETGQPFVTGWENVEKFYVRKRRNREPTDQPEYDDPVCSLSDAQKLRLCAIVMGSSELRDHYQFEPQRIFLESACTKREISFRTGRGLQASSEKAYEEWMIGCKPKELREHRYELLYVSRGYAANCAYVYKLVYGFVYLHHFVDNVSVLRD